MIDGIKSTIIFIRHHLVPFLLFLLAGCAIFLTTVLLNKAAISGYIEDDDYRSFTRSQYTFSTSNTDSQSFKALVSEIQNTSLKLDRVIISDPVTIRLRNNVTLETKLWAFFPDLEDDITIEDGARGFSDSNHELMITNDLFFAEEIKARVVGTVNNVDGHMLSQVDTESKGNLPEREAIGDIRVNESDPHTIVSCVFSRKTRGPGFYASYDHFFDLTDHCSEVIVRFQMPLNNGEESKFLAIVAKHLQVNAVAMPYAHDVSTKTEYIQNTVIFSIIEIASLYCIAYLFRFLVQLRADEFRIMRMVGGTRYVVFWQLLIMFLTIVIGSLLMGVLGLFLLRTISLTATWTEGITFQIIMRSILQYAVFLLLCAILHAISTELFKSPLRGELT